MRLGADKAGHPANAPICNLRSRQSRGVLIMSGFLSKKNREVIAWWGGGAVVVIAGLWTAFVYFFPPKPAGRSGGTGMTATNGGVTVGGNHSCIGDCSIQVLRGEKALLQRSYGNGSPNIANVDGNVEITVKK